MSFFADARIGVRRLTRAPLFVAFGILSLAFGIGTTTATYSVLQKLLGPPDGITTFQRLVDVQTLRSQNISALGLSYTDYHDLKTRVTTLERVVGWAPFRATWVANGQVHTSFGEVVSGDYFAVLGVNPVAGRLLQPSDDAREATRVAVISHSTWQAVFGGAPSAIGTLMLINGVAFEVVGVAPREFRGVFNAGLVPTAFWIPLEAARLVDPLKRRFDIEQRREPWILIKAWLRNGARVQQARTEVAALAKRIDVTDPAPPSSRSSRGAPRDRLWTVRMSADGGIDDSTGGVATPVASVLFSVVVVVLVVACTNLGHLTLARGSERRHELGVRMTLGATRWQLTRVALIEGLALTVPGSLAAIGVAHALLALLRREIHITDGASLYLTVTMDSTGFVVAVIVTGLTLLVTSLTPALILARSISVAALAADESHALPRRWRSRWGLIFAQVTVSSTLIALAAQCVSYLREERQRDVGFRVGELAVATIDFAAQGYDASQTRQVIDTVLERLRSRKDVIAAAAASSLPLGLVASSSVSTETGTPLVGSVIRGTDQMFETLGIPVVGTPWTAEVDRNTQAQVAIISRWTAAALFGGDDVVGKTIVVQEGGIGQRFRIIGLAGDTDVGTIGRRNRALVYTSFGEEYTPRMVVLVRVSGDPALFAETLRQAFASAQPSVRLTTVGRATDVIARRNPVLVVGASIAGVLGIIALILVLAGVYGLLAHFVACRAPEIGVRMALGATAQHVLRMVLRQGMAPIIVGLAVGLSSGALVGAVLSSRLGLTLRMFDPIVVLGVPATILVAAVIACIVPAHRAANIDPNSALRHI